MELEPLLLLARPLGLFPKRKENSLGGVRDIATAILYAACWGVVFVDVTSRPMKSALDVVFFVVIVATIVQVVWVRIYCSTDGNLYELIARLNGTSLFSDREHLSKEEAIRQRTRRSAMIMAFFVLCVFLVIATSAVLFFVDLSSNVVQVPLSIRRLALGAAKAKVLHVLFTACVAVCATLSLGVVLLSTMVFGLFGHALADHAHLLQEAPRFPTAAASPEDAPAFSAQLALWLRRYTCLIGLIDESQRYLHPVLLANHVAALARLCAICFGVVSVPLHAVDLAFLTPLSLESFFLLVTSLVGDRLLTQVEKVRIAGEQLALECPEDSNLDVLEEWLAVLNDLTEWREERKLSPFGVQPLQLSFSLLAKELLLVFFTSVAFFGFTRM